MSNAATERGLLVKLDEGFFARLDHETAIRRAALRAGWATAHAGLKHGTGIPPMRLHRTDVVRALLAEALDARALARGEAVPESVEADVTKSDRGATAFVGGAEPGSVPVKEADTEAVTAPLPVEAYPAASVEAAIEAGPVSEAVVIDSVEKLREAFKVDPLYYTDPGEALAPEKSIRGGVARLDGGDPAAATPEPEPEPVQVGHVGGEGALGPNVRMVGVRRT